MDACAICGFRNLPGQPSSRERDLIRVVDETGGHLMCSLCVIRLIGNLDQTGVAITLVLSERAELRQ